MFPGVNGFHWTFGHVLFISAFCTVFSVVAVTLLVALAKSRRAMKAGRADAIRWHSDYHDLAAADRACRHNITGEAPGRICPNEFDCRGCRDHAKYACPAEETEGEHFGLHFPANRYYHRGHTFVEPCQDGTVLIGLDAIARHLVGRPDAMQLPAVGTKLQVHGTAWRMWKEGQEVRVLAPVEGEVVEAGAPDDFWLLRVRPVASPTAFRHLLRGSEVRAWVGKELERLQMLFSPDCAQPTLADGGVLVPELILYAPRNRRDEILGGMFLEP